MFAPFGQTIEEDYFANINYNKNIECILPAAELAINFKANGINARKSCFVYAEKMDFKGLVQLRITEKLDQRKMYITTVDSTNFHELKQDQSLHVTFAGFVENLIRILQDCQGGKLEISLVQKVNNFHLNVSQQDNLVSKAVEEYQLQFIEMRPFKNLIHLCLPCRLASLNVVLFYMNSILEAMQSKTIIQEQTSQQLQHELHAHVRRIEQLDADNEKLRDQIMETSNSLNKRHKEEIEKLEESLRKSVEQRQCESDHSRANIASLQNQIDKLNIEKSNLNAEKMQEQKRSETLNEELMAAKSRISNMKEQIEKLHSEGNILKNNERKTEMHLNDARKHISELQEKIHKHEKSKADIIAELEAEKNILQTKRHALEMATEEISKANQIILKQSQELLKLKKTIELRTEVALQQEKAIKEKEMQINLRDQEIEIMKCTIETLKQEIPQQLQSLKEFGNCLEAKYADQIKALKDKIRCLDKENSSLASNSPPILKSSRRKY